MCGIAGSIRLNRIRFGWSLSSILSLSVFHSLCCTLSNLFFVFCPKPWFFLANNLLELVLNLSFGVVSITLNRSNGLFSSLKERWVTTTLSHIKLSSLVSSLLFIFLGMSVENALVSLVAICIVGHLF